MNSEHGPNKKLSLKTRAMRATGALGLASALYGAGVGSAAEFSSSSNNPSQAINAAINEDLAHSSALGLAQSNTDVLNSRGTIAPRVLNGQLEIMGKDGKYMPYIKYPILLSVNTAQPDKEGKFLEGAWLGFNGTGPQGNVVIDVMPFTNDTERFVAYNPQEVIFRNLGVYATSATTDGNSPDRLLVPQDLNGERTITGPDHTPIYVGEYVGFGK